MHQVMHNCHMLTPQGSQRVSGPQGTQKKNRAQTDGSNGRKNTGEAAVVATAIGRERGSTQGQCWTYCGGPHLLPKSHLCDICTNL